MNRRPLLLVLVALVSATLFIGVGELVAPSTTAHRLGPAVKAVPVDAVTLVCAQSPHQDSVTSTRTALGTGTPGEGTVTVEQVDRPSPSKAVGISAQNPVVADYTLTEKPVVVRATGVVAAGLAGIRVTRSLEPQKRGIYADRCVAPRTQFWFSGVSTGAQITSTLHLANADDSPAGVDVTGIDDKGPLSSVLTSGLLLAPHSSRDVSLADLAAGTAAMAVRVLATRGRVTASITESRATVPAPQGVDEVPAQDAAAPSVIIPGVPGVSSTVLTGATNEQTLYVAVPGTSDATVHVEITDESGRFLAVGADTFTVSAGTQLAVPLAKALTGSPVVLHVYADAYVPIVAGVSVTSKPATGDYRESLHIGPASRMSGASVVGELRFNNVAGSNIDSAIVLTSFAPGDGGVTISIPGVPAPVHRVIPANKSVTIRASTLVGPSIDPISVLITPDPGTLNVYAGVLLEEQTANGPLLGGYSISGGVGKVALPRVATDPALPLVDARG